MTKPAAESSSQRVGGALGVAIVSVAVLMSMGRLATADFTCWDDPVTVVHNPILNPPTWIGIAYYWAAPAQALYDPLVYTAWSGIALVARLNDASGGETLNPWVFHAANLLVHIGSALVVLKLLRRLGFDSISACAGALVFALHPVMVEPVGWVSGLKDLLAGFFALMAIEQHLAGREGKPIHRVIAPVCFVLAMLAKASAIVVPGVLLMIEWVYYHRSFRVAVRSVLLYALLVIPFLVIAALVQAPAVQWRVPLWHRPFIAGHTLAFYLSKLIWPARLAIDYGQTPQYVMRRGAPGWWAWIIPAAIAVAFLLRWKSPRIRKIGFGLLVFVVAMSPLLGFVSFGYQEKSSTADHYLYLPMLGIAIAAAALLQNRAGWVFLAGVAIVALGVQSFRQSATWHDDQALLRHTLEVNPRSWAAHTNLFILSTDAHEFDVALYHAAEAHRLRPDWALGQIRFAQAMENEHDLGGARRELMIAVRDHPDSVEAHLALALLDLKTGDAEEAKKEFDAAEGVHSSHPVTQP